MEEDLVFIGGELLPIALIATWDEDGAIAVYANNLVACIGESGPFSK